MEAAQVFHQYGANKETGINGTGEARGSVPFAAAGRDPAVHAIFIHHEPMHVAILHDAAVQHLVHFADVQRSHLGHIGAGAGAPFGRGVGVVIRNADADIHMFKAGLGAGIGNERDGRGRNCGHRRGIGIPLGRRQRVQQRVALIRILENRRLCGQGRRLVVYHGIGKRGGQGIGNVVQETVQNLRIIQAG